jgi:ribonuclease P protein component
MGDKIPDRRFRTQERIRLRSEFDRIYSARRFASNDKLTVYILENDLDYSRLGLSVSRKVGGAVVRNLIRRRIKEAFRKNKTDVPLGLDILCVVKPGPPATEQVYAESLRLLAARAAARQKKLPPAGTL